MRYALILIMAVALVGCRGASSSVGSVPPDAARAQTTVLPATPRPPSVGGGSAEANSSEMTPTPEPTVTPVEDVADSNLPTPAATVQQALEAQVDVRPDPNGEVAGSSPAEGSNESQLRAALEALWPASEVERAMRVAYCESRYDPAAVEPSGDHVGTFQVAPSIWGPVPGDIWGQVAQARVVYQTQGWQAWSCR